MAFLLLILRYILILFILICWQPILISSLRSAGVVNGLRHARIGAIGTRPAGFQTVRASEKLLQASGITVVPVDLSEILSAARKIEDADETLQAKLKEIRQYAAVPEQYNDKLILQAKFGVAVEQWMEPMKLML